MKRALTSVIACFLASFLTATTSWCGPADTFKSFLDNEVPQLSRDYAIAELNRRWFGTYMAFAIEAISVPAELSEQLSVASNLGGSEEKPSVSDVIAKLQIADDLIATLIRGRARLERLTAVASNLQGVCNALDVSDVFAIRTAGIRSVAQVMTPPPKKDGIYIGWDTSGWSTIVTFVYAYFSLINDKLERDKIEKLALTYPQKVIQPEEIQILSVKICLENEKLFVDAVSEATKQVESIAKEVGTAEQLVLSTRHEIEKVLLPMAYEDVLANASFYLELVRTAQETYSSEVLIKLEIAVNELDAIKANATTSGNCVAGASAVELYEDALIELQSQLTVLSKMDHERTVAKRLSRVHDEVEAALKGISQLYLAARGRSCQ